MSLFGRNKTKEEIVEIQNKQEDFEKELNKIDELKNKQKEFKKQLNEIKTYSESELKKITEKHDNEYESLSKQYEEKFLKVNDEIESLKKSFETVQNLLSNIVNAQKNILEKTEKQGVTKSETKKTAKKHLYDFKAELYPTVSLSGNNIIGKIGKLSFTIDDVINIKKNLSKYHEKGYSGDKIGRLHNIGTNTIQRVIWNIEEGVFDELILEYQQNNSVKEKHSHKINVGKSYKVKYKHTMNNKGELFTSTGRKIPYTIHDIIQIKKSIENENHNTPQEVLESIDCNYVTGCRLIWNIEEGNYDRLIEKYYNSEFDEDNVNDNHFRQIPKSLHKKLSGKLEVVDGGELLLNNRRLTYTIQDVLKLQERIPDFNKYPTFEDLFEGFDLSEPSLKMMVWRIEEGYYEDIIMEYLSRNYTYENNFNRLFIDGKNTGLSINKCIAIVECIINTPNKRDTVNKLIKMYPSIDSKYIRILSEEYNNPNLSKILKKEVRKIPKIDNPQKRREQGVFS